MVIHTKTKQKENGKLQNAIREIESISLHPLNSQHTLQYRNESSELPDCLRSISSNKIQNDGLEDWIQN